MSSKIKNPSDVLLLWDEFPWIEHRGGVKVCGIPVDAELHPKGAVLVAVEYPAGFSAERHHHVVGHLEIVLEGTLYVTGRAQPPLSIRVVDPDYEYGPLEARDGRCRVLEIFPDATPDLVAGKYAPEVLAQAGRTEADVLAGVEKFLGVDPRSDQA
jgi:hypothetical protein